MELLETAAQPKPPQRLFRNITVSKSLIVTVTFSPFKTLLEPLVGLGWGDPTAAYESSGSSCWSSVAF